MVDPVANLIEQTHQQIRDQLQKRLYYPSGLWLFSADTGLGKTTGFQLGMKWMWDNVHRDIPFLILVPTRKDAELMYRRMDEIETGCAAVWTQAHDPTDSATAEFDITTTFTKEDARKRKCLILTHNAGKDAEDWVGRRDIVLIDENPQPVSSGVVQPWKFFRARDDEAVLGRADAFCEAAEWAEEQERRFGLYPITLPEWVPKVLRASPATDHGKEIQRLASHIAQGTCFQQATGKSISWTWYEYNLPFQEKAIVFSATASYEGWHFCPLGVDSGPTTTRVNYQNVTANLVPWPSGISTMHKTILGDYSQREAFFDHIVSSVGYADERTLIVCPKDFESDIKRRIGGAQVTHWGCDIGSNAYRGCDTVWLVSLFHQPKSISFARYLGFADERATEANLEKAQRSGTGSFVKGLQILHHKTQIKQMGARGTCRNVGADGVADRMTLNCLFDADTFAETIPLVFPNCKLVYPTGYTPSLGKKNRSILNKIVDHLACTSQNYVAASELKEEGINIKGKTRKEKIKAAAPRFESLGWQFEEAPEGGGRGLSAGFRRTENGATGATQVTNFI